MAVRVACIGRTLASADNPSRWNEGLKALSAAIGNQHACSLRSDHSVVCWGSNAAGQLGLGPENVSSVGKYPGQMGDNLIPVELPAGLLSGKCRAKTGGTLMQTYVFRLLP